jgi:hypothetical protein
MQELVLGIADVENSPASHKALAELFDDRFDEGILSTRRNGYGFAGRKFHRDTSEFAVALKSLTDLLAARQVSLSFTAPFQRSGRPDF